MPMPLHRILLVEDNPGDVELTRRAFRELPVEIEVVKDGEQALERLFDASKPTPDVVLLDLNLPRVTGWEVLEQAKRSPLTKRIPIVVLTSSEADNDILKSYDLHVNGYMVKPPTPDKLFGQTLYNYWFTYSRLPRS
jgi:CheY-like chemotaxis protein